MPKDSIFVISQQIPYNLINWVESNKATLKKIKMKNNMQENKKTTCIRAHIANTSKHAIHTTSTSEIIWLCRSYDDILDDKCTNDKWIHKTDKLVRFVHWQTS